MPNFGMYGFVTVTNETLLIQGVEGWGKISIFVTSNSAGDLTIQGATNQVIGQKLCATITLSAGESITLEDENGIDGITLTVPSNCIIKIVAVKSKNNI
jgi:hypothetical protein